MRSRTFNRKSFDITPLLIVAFGLGLSPVARAKELETETVPCLTSELQSRLEFPKGSRWLESDSPERSNWVRIQNGKTFAAFKDSPNYQKVGEFLKEEYSDPGKKGSPRYAVSLSPTETLAFESAALGKPTQLVLNTKGREAEVLYSNLDLTSNHTSTFVDITVSPDLSKIVMTFSRNGSIDRYIHRVYDLKARRLLKMEFESNTLRPVWTGKSMLRVEEINSKNVSVLVDYDLTNDVTSPPSKRRGAGELLSRKNGWGLQYTPRDGQTSLINGTAEIHLDNQSPPRAIFGSDENHIYLLQSRHGDSAPEIRKIEKVSDGVVRRKEQACGAGRRF